MKVHKSIQAISTDQAKEKDLLFNLSLTPEQRLKRLMQLRKLNLGEKASTEISKKIVLIK